MLTRFEQDGLVEPRRNKLGSVVLGLPGIGVQLEVSTPLLLPFRREVNDHVQPAMPPFGVVVEIDVKVELLAIEVFVRAPADIIGIIQQMRNARNLFDE